MVVNKCGIIGFHATTKENIKKIMKEGIKPGMKGGWCDIAARAIGRKLSDDEIEECKNNIFVSGSLDHAIETYYPELPDLDTVVVVCVPQEKAFLYTAKARKEKRDEPFEEWDLRRFEEMKEEEQFISQYPELRIKDTIPPENIIGCLDIVKEYHKIPNIYNKPDWDAPNRYRYKINRDCK